ncbi:hypothetical protein MPNT_10121 [Candidatus Methylacidithermus pantelleriae]|uniref:Uncharacterized protein n=1 Tax=Candidatus Methylacidithermus pantelleriae TaxID=2744239 RepID=A0A8J2FRJ4_9BACT|nr:hypothetical protein MPNT_10121 [Candidatus Methylacidithermus pantelleriae]
MHPNAVTDKIVCDLDEVMVSLCARLYGKRFARKRGKKVFAGIDE